LAQSWHYRQTPGAPLTLSPFYTPIVIASWRR